MNFSDLLSAIKNGKGVSKSHIKNLIEMAAAGGNFLDEAFDLLKSIAKEHGISESHRIDIRKHPRNIKFEIPKNGAEKFQQLFDLGNMMSIDNKVHSKEAERCTSFAINFGYLLTHVNESIDIIRATIKNGQSVQETKKWISMIIG